jgi:hypothetical protein
MDDTENVLGGSRFRFKPAERKKKIKLSDQIAAAD